MLWPSDLASFVQGCSSTAEANLDLDSDVALWMLRSARRARLFEQGWYYSFIAGLKMDTVQAETC